MIGEEAFTYADHFSQETSLSVTGTVRADTRAKGGYEIDVAGVEVHGEARDYPITPKEHGVVPGDVRDRCAHGSTT